MNRAKTAFAQVHRDVRKKHSTMFIYELSVEVKCMRKRLWPSATSLRLDACAWHSCRRSNAAEMLGRFSIDLLEKPQTLLMPVLVLDGTDLA